MRILLLTHAFNSLTQRLWTRLAAAGHEVSIEFDIADAVTQEAVELFRPQLVIAPYLRRAIPESVWSRVRCLIVHPGIVGDRGPSALDWALQENETRWGVTVLQAQSQLDGGPVWAAREFPLRPARKSSIYRHEVAEAAMAAVFEAIERIESACFTPVPASQWPGARGRARPPMRQDDRAIDWSTAATAQVLRRIRAADGFPGVADSLFGVPCRLFDAWPEAALRGGPPGAVIARRETALLRATVDGAVWIGQVRCEGSIKLPATIAFADESADVPATPLPGWWREPQATWQDIAYEEHGDVGVLHFHFYNGAMATRDCERLAAAFSWARSRPTRVIVLAGGADFWSNGIHLNVIEGESLAGRSAADESWRNINALDDLARDVITTQEQLTVAALAGDAGAGGCFLARAADEVWANAGTMLNPHYRNMGNLYGSEYWSYLLPRRIGVDASRRLLDRREPLTASQAQAIGLVDACIPATGERFAAEVIARAQQLAWSGTWAERLARKRRERAADEAAKPLAAYREEELAHMRRNFYGFDPSYHVARHRFVHKAPVAWTPRHLARHRELGWRTP
jgi:putative two-component system protein, hydrogenase maturation factor HypX/HoxX